MQCNELITCVIQGESLLVFFCECVALFIISISGHNLNWTLFYFYFAIILSLRKKTKCHRQLLGLKYSKSNRFCSSLIKMTQITNKQQLNLTADSSHLALLTRGCCAGWHEAAAARGRSFRQCGRSSTGCPAAPSATAS